MSSSLERDYPWLFDALIEQHWSISIRHNGHLAFIAPSGAKVYASATPSDRRARLNLIRDLKRAGLKVERPR